MLYKPHKPSPRQARYRFRGMRTPLPKAGEFTHQTQVVGILPIGQNP